MKDKANKLIVRLEELFNLKKSTFVKQDIKSVFDIARIPRDQFIRKHFEFLSHSAAGDLYDRSMGYAQQVAFAYRQQRQIRAGGSSSPFSINGPSYIDQFNPNWQAMAPAESIGANTSPAAYLTSLYNLALRQEANAVRLDKNFIADRRPDIPDLVIDEDAVYKVVPTLEIVNNVLNSAIQIKSPQASTDTLLASTYYPNTLPYHFAYEQAQSGMEACETTLADIKLQADRAWPYFAEPAVGYTDELVNSYTLGTENASSIAALSDGGWVVVWQSKGQDSNGLSVYQQRFDPSGVKVGLETQVNNISPGNKERPAVCGLDDGGWVVVWEDKEAAVAVWQIYQQRYDHKGSPLHGEAPVHTLLTNNQQYASVASLSDGGWIVVWAGSGLEAAAAWNIYQQRFDNTGQAVPGELQVNSPTTVNTPNALVSGLKNGGWIVAYGGDPRFSNVVWQQRYDASGAKKGNPINLSYSSLSYLHKSLTGLEDGGWVLTNKNNYGSNNIALERYNSEGIAEIYDDLIVRGQADESCCSSLKDGGWVVVWSREGGIIYQQRFDSINNKGGAITKVSPTQIGGQKWMNVAGLADGGWVVTWTGENSGVFQQRFDKLGVARNLLSPSVQSNDAIRIASNISPALRDTIEHKPYFSTFMSFVSGDNDFQPIGQSHGSALPLSKYSVSEFSPWYDLSQSAYITPTQNGLISGPQAITQESQYQWTFSEIDLKNVIENQKITIKGYNSYIRYISPKIKNPYAEYIHLNNIASYDPNNNIKYQITMPVFQFSSDMKTQACVSFYVRMYDITNTRYWRDISYTFASSDYQHGQIYTDEQLSFYNYNFGTALAVTIDQYYASNFSDVYELTRQTGLSVPELEDMLSIQVGADKVVVSPNIAVRNLAFVDDNPFRPTSDQTIHEPYHYGAVYLHGGMKPSMSLSTSLASDGEVKLTLNDLTDDRMDRMNRIIRLHRLLRIPYDELDYLVTAGMNAEGFASDKSDGNLGLYMNANTTRLLGVFNHYQQHYGATAEQFAAITDHITPYAIAPKVPLLDRLFNRRQLFDQPYVVDWKDVDPTAATTTRDARIMKQLASGLNISDVEMQFLAAKKGGHFNNSLESISAFYRIVTLSRWLGLDVMSFMQLVEMLDNLYEGTGLLQQVMAGPSIKPISNQPYKQRDWLDWLMVLSATTDWMAQSGVSVIALVSSLSNNDTQGTQGQLDFIQQLSEATTSTLVTQNLLVHANLPQTDGDEQPIDWISLLSGYVDSAGINHQLIDIKGLVLDDLFTLNQQQIDDTISVIVDSQNLTADAKATAKKTLGALIYAAQQSQHGILCAVLAQQLGVEQGAILPFCRWADVTPYLFLRQILDQKALSDPQAIDTHTIQLLNRFAQYAKLTRTYEMTPALLDVFTQHRTWFEVDMVGVTLRTHFGLACYRQWLHWTSETEDDLLSCLMINDADKLQNTQELITLLAGTLAWDANSTATAITYVTGTQTGAGTTISQIAGIMRLQGLCAQTGLSIDDLMKVCAISLESLPPQWENVGQAAAVCASLAGKPDDLAKQLNESHRDALLAYYEGYVVPEMVGESDITDEDVYQYLLIDPDVSEAVDTSQVAQAISSLQQYLYRIAFNQEPGFEAMSQSDIDEWRDIDSQYAIWSATQQVSDYPENYIAPSTRQNKSTYFIELENTLNQSQLDPAQVQDAVMTYLNEFEDVGNLQVVNGYCAEIEFDSGKYFFVGRTAEQPYRYYWRSMDLSKNGGSKDNPVITPNCWNDWQLIDLPLSGDTVLSWTIRPVYFNNRLYITWAERNPTPTEKDGKIHQYTVHYGYLRYDNTWAPPAIGDLQTTLKASQSQVLANKALEVDESLIFEDISNPGLGGSIIGPEAELDPAFNIRSIDTVAHIDFNRGAVGDSRIEGNLFIGLFLYNADQQLPNDKFSPRAFVYCDTSMIDLVTVSTLMDANFNLYKPTTNPKSIGDIGIQPIQYCSLGKRFEFVPGSLKSEGTEDDAAWGNSFPDPTVAILPDGITLEVLSSIGNCPDTANNLDHKNKWWSASTVAVQTNPSLFVSEYPPNRDHFCDVNGNNVESVIFTKDDNYYRSSDLYFYIWGGWTIYNVELVYLLNGNTVETLPLSNKTYHQGPNSTVNSIDIKIPTNVKFDGVTLTYYSERPASSNQPAKEYKWNLNNYINFKGINFPVNEFQPEIYLDLQNHNIRLEERRLPARTEYAPGTALNVSHSIDLIEDLPADASFNSYYNYQVSTQMVQLSDGVHIKKGTKKWKFQVQLSEDDTTPKTGPTIRTRYDDTEGTVQFLSFEGLDNSLNTTNDDGDVNITALIDGGWVVTWVESFKNTSKYNILLQRYNRAGARVGTKVKVNTLLDQSQYGVSVAGLKDGGWVAVWQRHVGKYFSIQQRRFDKTGAPVTGESQISTLNSVDNWKACVAALHDGGWVVVWQDAYPTGLNIRQIAFNANGKQRFAETSIYQVPATVDLGFQRPMVAGLVKGGWTITWINITDDTYSVKKKHYTNDDSALTPSAVVVSTGNGNALDACVCGLSDGGYVIAWQIFSPEQNKGIYQQRYNIQGVALDDEVMVNTKGHLDISTPSIAALDDGGWVVIWQSKVDNTRSWDVFQQRYDSEGNTVDVETVVNSYTTGDQYAPVIAGLADDINSEQDAGWVVAWLSIGQANVNRSVYQQYYSSSGKSIGGEELVSALVPKGTRLNTTFVPLLIQKANDSLNALLSYYTQATKVEPPLLPHPHSESELERMDYNGANGLYFWELFFHLPFMVASRFADEGQNKLALEWYHYIFDPAAKNKPADGLNDITPPDYWNNYAISTGTDLTATNSYMAESLLDPDALAYANPVIYQKTVYLYYIQTLIALGDSQYRLVSRDSLTAARVYYDLALALLGPNPSVSVSEQWQPLTLGELAKLENSTLRSFELNAELAILELPSTNSNALALLDNPNFRAPLNTDLLAYWKTLDARLYNLRNNLSIDGKPLNLALFEVPVDPRALLSQRAAAGSQSHGGLAAGQIILPYRFQAMLPVATASVNMLTQYGDLLLSYIERGEAAQQVELGQQQIVDLSGFAISLQQYELDALNADTETLQAQLAMTDQRYQYYWDNYNENISDAEQQTMEFQTEAMRLGLVETGFYMGGAAADMAPNIFGLAGGGMHWGGVTQAIGLGINITRQSLDMQASRLERSENYRRRRQEWQQQYIQAQMESEVINKQLDALAIRQQAVKTSITQAKVQQQQQQAMLKFLRSRFTQAKLYQWLNGQLSALYYQAYDSVLSLCLNVQSCWQYELGDFDTTFIRTNAWNSSYRGLLAGQALTLDLHRMERAYYARNDRKLNISRTVSLKALLVNATEDFATQKSKGRFIFDFTETLFNQKHPGHYARRLQQVSVTLPTLLGPYQDVSAILSQSRSQTLLQPDIDGVKFLNDPKTGGDTNIVTNLRPSQQVALSGGLDDDGTFALMMQDGRYLPFEGTGAVSKWSLSFPRAVDTNVNGAVLKADSEQAALLQALDDVLIHIQYTALDGGKRFTDEVMGVLKTNEMPASPPNIPKQIGRKLTTKNESAHKH